MRSSFCFFTLSLGLILSTFVDAAEARALLVKGVASVGENGLLEVTVRDSDLTADFKLSIDTMGRVTSAQSKACSTSLADDSIGRVQFTTPFPNILSILPAAGNEAFFNLVIRIAETDDDGTDQVVGELLSVVTDAPGERGWNYLIETDHLALKQEQSFFPDFGADLKVHVDADGVVHPGFRSVK